MEDKILELLATIKCYGDWRSVSDWRQQFRSASEPPPDTTYHDSADSTTGCDSITTTHAGINDRDHDSPEAVTEADDIDSVSIGVNADATYNCERTTFDATRSVSSVLQPKEVVQLKTSSLNQIHQDQCDISSEKIISNTKPERASSIHSPHSSVSSTVPRRAKSSTVVADASNKRHVKDFITLNILRTKSFSKEKRSYQEKSGELYHLSKVNFFTPSSTSSE